MKIISHIAAIALVSGTMSQPVLARASGETAANGTKAVSSLSTAAKTDSAKTHCLTVEASTGSRLAKKICRTKAEWLDEGVQIQTKK